MKKATLIIWVIIVGFIALVIFQNQDFFLAKNNLRLHLGVFDEYIAPELPTAVVLIFFFLAGIIIAHLFNFSARFKAKRTIKRLNADITSKNADISQLKGEINTLKGIIKPAVDPAADADIDMNATPQMTDKGSADKSLEGGAVQESSQSANDTGENSSEKKK